MWQTSSLLIEQNQLKASSDCQNIALCEETWVKKLNSHFCAWSHVGSHNIIANILRVLEFCSAYVMCSFNLHSWSQRYMWQKKFF